jgi:heavy metal sensor kinase
VETPDDELGRLAQAFNATLGRLEQSFDQMRRFTADASHELRTPLTAVRSVGEVGLQSPRSAEGYREVIGSMLEEVDRLNQLVESLLTLSRADAGHTKLARQRLDFASFIEDTITQVDVLAEERRQRVITELQGPVWIAADAVLLRRAIINVLDNAIKYAPLDSAIRVRLSIVSDQAVLSIEDQGPGIAAADLAHIFDRFYRVDRARSRQPAGVGLGLSIARWAVEAHGGEITVASQPGRGSTFRISLPMDRP